MPGKDGKKAVIPDHVLIGGIGQGSYGDVWLGRSTLGSLRAVKIVRRGRFGDARPYERELSGIRKYEPVSREHEGLVDILQVGSDEEQGFFYCVMELADDAGHGEGQAREGGRMAEPDGDYVPETLARKLKVRGSLPVAEVVELGTKLALALEFLHSRGLVHRDLKPSNIIFIGGQPKLADVGTVAELGDTLSYVGTLGYMPAEGPGSIRADIYSLGKILYQAATGKDVQEFPDLPLKPGFLRDKEGAALLEMNEVLLKACDTDPAQRYQSAAEMVAELKVLQGGNSLRRVRARRQCVERARVAALWMLGIGVVAGSAWMVASSTNHGPAADEPKVLFTADFSGSQLDMNYWSWGTNNGSSEFKAVGERDFRVYVTNDELVLHGRARHKDNRTTQGLAWADLKTDLRKLGECYIEVELTGTNQGGYSMISISDGKPIAATFDPTAVRLVTMPETSLHPNVSKALNHTRVGVEVLPRQRAAIVYPDAKVRENYEVVDLKDLEDWHLRFLVNTASSLRCTNSFTDLRILRMTIRSMTSPPVIVGHVVHNVTGEPVPYVSVMSVADQPETVAARAQVNGGFKLSPDTWPARLQARDELYHPSEARLISRDDSLRGLVSFRLDKREEKYGDVVTVIPLGEECDSFFGGVGRSLWLVSNVGPFARRETVLRQFDLQTGRRVLPEFRFPLEDGKQGLPLFDLCGDRILAVAVHPARIFELWPMKQTYTLLANPTRIDGREVFSPSACAFDGQHLWVLEDSQFSSQPSLHGLDLDLLAMKHCLSAEDTGVRGLAWDPDEQQFWVASITDGGKVYPVNREKAIRRGAVEAGIGKEFKGKYHRIVYRGKHLWALIKDKEIWQIKVTP